MQYYLRMNWEHTTSYASLETRHSSEVSQAEASSLCHQRSDWATVGKEGWHYPESLKQCWAVPIMAVPKKGGRFTSVVTIR